MLRLSKQADYGIVLLSYFLTGAPNGGGVVRSARELAEEAGLPLPTVSKVLKGLARGGILASHRGVHGGYTLARPAAEINVAQIVAVLDGEIGVTDCSPLGGRECSHEPNCPVRDPLQRLNAVVRNALGRVSLDDLLAPVLPSGVHDEPGDRHGDH